MKEFLSLFMFGIGALCFAVFLTTLKPAAITPAVNLAHRSTMAGTLPDRPQLLAAALRLAVRQR